MRHLFFLVCALLLSSCMAVMAVGTAAGFVIYDKRSVRVIEKDARIFHQVHTPIVRDSDFAGSRVDVSTFNQMVLLVGQVENASLRVQAEKVARSTPQVLRVYDELSVQAPISYSQRTKDSWITGEVRTKMLSREGLSSGSFKVVTEDATVYLMGIVTPEQAEIAVDVARKVKGVRKVVKVFQYKKPVE